MIRHAITEVLFRRFEVEQANREQGEEEARQREMRNFQRHGADEQHRHGGAAIVAEGKEQRGRVCSARRSVFDARDAQGFEVQQQHDAINWELEQEHLLAVERQRKIREETRSMEVRSKQNVAGVKEANRNQGQEGRIEALLNESAVSDARQARLDEKLSHLQDLTDRLVKMHQAYTS